MVSTNQMLRTAAFLTALLIPIGVVVSLYYGLWPNAEGSRVGLCNTNAQGEKAEPILKLNDAQCEAIARAVKITSDDRLPGEELTTFEEQKTPIRLGQAPPDEVRAVELPADVTTEFPDLRTYTYFVSGNTIALVDPQQSKLVAFVEVKQSSRDPGLD